MARESVSELTISVADLDFAWAEAEAAIPDEPEWGGPSVYRFNPIPADAEQGPYGAWASPPGDTGRDGIYGYGDTPAAALRALAARLRERSS